MKDIPGFEGLYSITLDGRVWSYPKHTPFGGHFHCGRWMAARVNKAGYPMVGLRKNRLCYCRSLHRLVMLTFAPRPDADELEVNHINGIKTDPRRENLEWTTRGENLAHAWRTGAFNQTKARQAAGFRRGVNLRRLSDAQVGEIRQLLTTDNTQESIARRFGVSRKSIHHIRKGITYLHTRGQLP